MIQVTDEMNTAYWAAMHNAARTGSSASPHREGLAAVLAIVERDLPRCPFVEWGLKVRLCSLPIGHDGDHDLKDRVLS